MPLSLRIAAPAALVSALVLAAPSRARADEADAEQKNECATAAEDGQKLRDETKLVEARARMVSCAQKTCPAIVRRECMAWLDSITERVPTIVPSVRDDAGNDVASARMLLDGSPLGEGLVGTAIAVNPGRHLLVAERPDGARAEVAFVAREGEHGRVVSIVMGMLPPSSPAPAAAPRADAAPLRSSEPVTNGPRSLPVGAYVTGAVGVLALGVAAVAGISGVVDYEHLKSACAPTCAHDEVTRARTKLQIATVAGAIGIVAGGASLGLVLLRRPGAAVSVGPTLGAQVGWFGRVTFE